jgi:hypothetical protein
MSFDKVTRRVNRVQANRVIRNQTAIWSLYNEQRWLESQKPRSFSKGKAMNCSCRICRGWDKDGRRHRYNYQLEKAGMHKYDERPDIITQEEDWI